MDKVKTILILILTGVLICMFISKCNNTPSISAPIKVKVLKVDSTYKAETSIYKKQNDSLAVLLADANTKLIQSKASLSTTQNKLYKLIKGGTGATNCDTIKATTITYITQVDSTLNDYAAKDSIQTGLIAIKDKQIIMCDSSYNVMAGLSKELIKDLHKSEKRNQRNKTLAKIFGTALFVTAAIIGASQLK